MPAPGSTEAAAARTVGYYLLGADGGVFAFGAAPFRGTANDAMPGRCWVALGRSAGGEQLIAVSSDGSIAFLGAAEGFDDMGQTLASAPAIDVAVTPDGRGFWVLDAEGGVFTLGDASYHGSIPGLGERAHTERIVAMSSTATGKGYRILDEAGGIYCFGDAEFYGSTWMLNLDSPPAPAVDLVTTPTGYGYAVLESTGVIRSFGDALYRRGVLSDHKVAAVAFEPTGSPGSYAVVDARGFVFPVGEAPMAGSAAHLELAAPIVDIAASFHTGSSSS